MGIDAWKVEHKDLTLRMKNENEADVLEKIVPLSSVEPSNIWE